MREKQTITGKRILLLMEKKGIKTQIELSKKLNAFLNTKRYNAVKINRWIKKDPNIKGDNYLVEDMVDLCRFFGCSLDYLFGLTDIDEVNSNYSIINNLGLTDKSIDTLKDMNESKYHIFTEFLNCMLSSREGIDVIRNISQYYSYCPVNDNDMIIKNANTNYVDSYDYKKLVFNADDYDELLLKRIEKSIIAFKKNSIEYYEANKLRLSIYEEKVKNLSDEIGLLNEENENITDKDRMVLLIMKKMDLSKYTRLAEETKEDISAYENKK